MIIVDPGSCHDGSLTKAKELVKIAADCGADACKFQLIGDKEIARGNVLLPWEWMIELVDEGETRGIQVFASVFDKPGVEYMSKIGCKSIKFAYCERDKAYLAYKRFDKIYVSSGIMDYQTKWAINLYCIPEYPVLYHVDFEEMFPRFDGFSDHTLGIRQTKGAIFRGAKIIEKHIKGTWDSPCLDAKFAITPKELTELCKYDCQKN